MPIISYALQLSMTFTSHFSISSTINLLMASTKSRQHISINKESPKKIGVVSYSSKIVNSFSATVSPTFYHGTASMALDTFMSIIKL